MRETSIHAYWRPNRKAFPYADDAVAIARALGTSVEYLVTGEGTAHEQRNPELEEIFGLLRGRTHDDLMRVRGLIEGYIDQHLTADSKKTGEG